MLLVTGSAGLIGRRIVSLLRAAGHDVREFDFRKCPSQDTRNHQEMRRALVGVTGIIHLAAISRVVWAERSPALADEVNVEALRGLLELCAENDNRPWLIFASSREVYGEQHLTPVAEDAQLLPLNHYARSKVAGENLVNNAREAGLNTAICRFSNVYGCIDDHPDRVMVAFARAAALGGEIRVEGGENTFDFTHVDDVALGLMQLVELVAPGERPPPVHFVSGTSTSLTELAELAIKQARQPVQIKSAPARTFDVGRFRGDRARAQAILGWTSRTSVEDGFSALVDQFSNIGEARTEDLWLHSLVKTEDPNRASGQYGKTDLQPVHRQGVLTPQVG